MAFQLKEGPRLDEYTVELELKPILELAEPLAASMGYEILLAEIARERGINILRIYLDLSLERRAQENAPLGVNLEDCEKFSRALDPVLEVEAEITEAYQLEVSSPGVDRPLVRKEHFAQQVGQIIQVTSSQDIEGRRKFKGELLDLVEQGEETYLQLRVDREIFEIPLPQIKKAQLDYFASLALQKKVKAKRGHSKEE